MDFTKQKQIDNDIKEQSNLILQAFFILDKEKAFLLRSNTSEIAIQKLKLYFPKLSQKQILNLYAEAKKANDNPDYINLLKRNVTATPINYDKTAVLIKNRELTSWFDLFNTTKTTLPVIQIDSPDSISDSVFNLGYNTPENKNEIMLSIMDVDSFDHNLINSVYYDQILKGYDVPIDFVNGNHFSIRHEIADAVKNFELKMGVYDNTFSATDIPLYFVAVIGAHRGIHLTLFILCNNQTYTIGLGYYGETEKHDQINIKTTKLETKLKLPLGLHSGVSSLYTPDYLLDINLDNRIVDIGILSSIHLNKLGKFITSANTLTGICVIDPNDSSNILVKQSFLTGLPQQYFTISNNILSDSYINCTSFITKIFSNINCQKGIPINPVIPTWCNTIPPTGPDKIQEAFNLFYDTSSTSAIKLVELLKPTKKRKICSDNECIISGGKYKKSRKNKKSKKVRKTRKNKKSKESKKYKTKRKI